MVEVLVYGKSIQENSPELKCASAKVQASNP